MTGITESRANYVGTKRVGDRCIRGLAMSAPTVGVLPTAPQILCAFQGRRFQDRELLRSAHALAELHARRREVRDVHLVAEIDCRRSELVDDINEWIAQEIPQHRNGASLHTESLGAVVDRMARNW